MARECSICKHPQLNRIDRDLAAGARSLRGIARAHGIPEATLRGHRDHQGLKPAEEGGKATALHKQALPEGTNAAAVARMVRTLEAAGVIAEADAAEVALVLSLAQQVDERPASSALSRELRLATAALRDREVPVKHEAEARKVARMIFELEQGWAADTALAHWNAVKAACLEAGLDELNASRIAHIATDGRLAHGSIDWGFEPIGIPGVEPWPVRAHRDHWRAVSTFG